MIPFAGLGRVEGQCCPVGLRLDERGAQGGHRALVRRFPRRKRRVAQVVVPKRDAVSLEARHTAARENECGRLAELRRARRAGVHCDGGAAGDGVVGTPEVAGLACRDPIGALQAGDVRVEGRELDLVGLREGARGVTGAASGRCPPASRRRTGNRLNSVPKPPRCTTGRTGPACRGQRCCCR